MRIDVKKNTIMGTIAGVTNKVVVTFFPFIMRTIMIHYMGTQYLGLSSLFSSILSMLSLAELGFGTALVYSMYKPIAENDTRKICALMGLYKKIYRIIGTIILIAGLLLTPFIGLLINGEVPTEVNIYVLFWIYLLNTVASYFLFAYKNSLLVAFQRNDISSNVSTVLTAIEYGIQITLVITFRNYYCYAVVFPLFTVLGNIVRSIIVDKMYPQYICKGSVDKEERKEIYRKTFALASHKIGNTISTSFDSMVVSAFLGLSCVGIFGNYNYIAMTVMSLVWIVYYSMTAGIGNRMNLNSVDENYKDFMALTSFNNVVLCWATGCMLFLYQPFMELWAGKENLLSTNSAIIFSVYFYVYQSRKVVLVYKDAAGLWKEDQWKPIVGAILNLIINIVLVQVIGINGVILSSIISFMMVEIPWESIVLYRCYFKKSIVEYVGNQLKTLTICLPCWAVLGLLCGLVNATPVLSLLMKMGICAVLPLPYLWIVYKNDRHFVRVIEKAVPQKLRKYM
ncbi:MAG: polysaccharide biosynthesis protein [Hespellia sp.]|nr:polysaccharide biosynthesis protein [Hespellia sp.]